MTDDHVDLKTHTGVQRLLQSIDVCEQYYDHSANGDLVEDARAELQKLVDDACRQDMAFADYRQRAENQRSADVAAVHTELDELKGVVSALRERQSVNAKTIARLEKERDAALTQVDQGDVHHDEHHAREDELRAEIARLKELHTSTIMRAALAVNADVDNAVDALPAIEARIAEQEKVVSYLQERIAAREAAVVENDRLKLEVESLKVLTDELTKLRDLAVAACVDAQNRHAELERERDEMRGERDRAVEKSRDKLKAAGQRLSAYHRVMRDLLVLAKSKVTVVDAFPQISAAERLLREKELRL